MPDDMDLVQAHNEQHQIDALDKHQRSRSTATASRTNCIDCGYEIPQRRRKASPGCIRCIDCQEILEGFKGSVR